MAPTAAPFGAARPTGGVHATQKMGATGGVPAAPEGAWSGVGHRARREVVCPSSLSSAPHEQRAGPSTMGLTCSPLSAMQWPNPGSGIKSGETGASNWTSRARMVRQGGKLAACESRFDSPLGCFYAARLAASGQATSRQATLRRRATSGSAPATGATLPGRGSTAANE